MSLRIAIVVDGERAVHAANDPTGNYATLCGLDGGFEGVEEDGQITVKVRQGEKIDCPTCRAVWLAAKTYRKTDFV